MQIPLRWVAICIFVLSSSLNFLDRQLLAALAPTLREEFHLSNAEYGQILSVFSIVYAAVAPFAGWFVDRVGLTLGTGIAVTVWSLAGASTSVINSFGGLLAVRTVLGAAEAAGVPAAGKANATFLEPREFTLGAAANQIGISLGAVGAPLLVAALAPRYGWRSTFAICGLLGLLWVPLWWFTSRKIPPREPRPSGSGSAAGVSSVLRDPRAWGIAIANIWVMTVYTLWTNWTTLYFVAEHGLTQDEANRRFAWIPPVLAAAGGFFGGWLAYRAIRNGVEAIRARVRACWISALALLGTALVPLMPNAILAAAAVSLSFFWSLALSTNVYALPLDLFGARRAAFAVSMLTSSYGLMQTIVSPAIGWMVDGLGFAPVCAGIAILPLMGVGILHRSLK